MGSLAFAETNSAAEPNSNGVRHINYRATGLSTHTHKGSFAAFLKPQVKNFKRKTREKRTLR